VLSKMPKVTPDQFVNKWKTNLKSATSYIRDGVNAVTESPTAKAAAQQDKWFTNLQAAKDAGKWKDGLNNVSLDYWKQRMAGVGVNRISDGVNNADVVMNDFASKLLAHEASLQATVRAKPNKTIDDSVARAEAWIRGMHGWSYVKPKR
jgi:hypothetical protein